MMMSAGSARASLIETSAALATLAPVCAAIKAASGGPGSTYIVGGAVRDALLGRTIADIDLCTVGDAEQTARSLARAHGGTCFPLSDEHGCWRIMPGADRKLLLLESIVQIDICSLVGDALDSDLADRDFTINALAVAVDEPHCPDRPTCRS